MAFLDALVSGDVALRAELGETVTYTSGVGASVPVRGIYDEAYVRVDAGSPGVSSSGPAIFLRLAELSSNPKTDTAATVTRAGSVYRVHEVQPDGLGWVLLHLHEV